MERNQLNVVVIVVGILCIAGIGAVSATFLTAENMDPGERGAIIDPPNPVQEIEPNVSGVNNSGQGTDNVPRPGYNTMTTCIEFFDTTLGMLSVIAGFLALTALLYMRFNIAVTLLLAWTIGPPIGLAYFLVTDCGATGEEYVGGGVGGGLGVAGNQVVETGDVPPWAILGLIGGVVVVAGFVLWRTATVDESPPPVAEEEDEEPDLGRFAAAAGRAAERIAERNAEVDNAVYRAWVEMTDLLDVEDPDIYTPGEFAEEAIEIGMAEDDVRELTHLFNEVRYGQKDASVRADRAVDVLRNIESEYGDDAEAADVDVDAAAAVDADEADADAVDDAADATDDTDADDTSEDEK